MKSLFLLSAAELVAGHSLVQGRSLGKFINYETGQEDFLTVANQHQNKNPDFQLKLPLEQAYKSPVEQKMQNLLMGTFKQPSNPIASSLNEAHLQLKNKINHPNLGVIFKDESMGNILSDFSRSQETIKVQNHSQVVKSSLKSSFDSQTQSYVETSLTTNGQQTTFTSVQLSPNLRRTITEVYSNHQTLSEWTPKAQNPTANLPLSMMVTGFEDDNDQLQEDQDRDQLLIQPQDEQFYADCESSLGDQLDNNVFEEEEFVDLNEDSSLIEIEAPSSSVDDKTPIPVPLVVVQAQATLPTQSPIQIQVSEPILPSTPQQSTPIIAPVQPQPQPSPSNEAPVQPQPSPPAEAPVQPQPQPSPPTEAPQQCPDSFTSTLSNGFNTVKTGIVGVFDKIKGIF